MQIRPVEKPLQLTNNGELEIVFIGVGSAFSRSLYHTNFLIIKGSTHILVDFGTTGPHSIGESTGVDISNIEVLLPTHSHCDHIGGIEQLALWNRYVAIPKMNKRKLNMIITEEYQGILWNQSLRGGMEWNEVNVEGVTLSFEDYFEQIIPVMTVENPRPVYELDFGGLHLEIFGTNHIPEQARHVHTAFPTYGLMIDNRVFYSGDTKFDKELIDRYASRSECMFHDTSFIANPVHASLEELKTLPVDVKQKMFLVHYGDNWTSQDVSDFAGLTERGVRYIFD